MKLQLASLSRIHDLVRYSYFTRRNNEKLKIENKKKDFNKLTVRNNLNSVCNLLPKVS